MFSKNNLKNTLNFFSLKTSILIHINISHSSGLHSSVHSNFNGLVKNLVSGAVAGWAVLTKSHYLKKITPSLNNGAIHTTLHVNFSRKVVTMKKIIDMAKGGHFVKQLLTLNSTIWYNRKNVYFFIEGFSLNFLILYNVRV